jgi:hypothetical protein
MAYMLIHHHGLNKRSVGGNSSETNSDPIDMTIIIVNITIIIRKGLGKISRENYIHLRCLKNNRSHCVKYYNVT